MKWMQSLQRTILCVTLVAFATPAAAQDRIPWLTDLRQARDMAERENRLVLLHFWTETCVPCKQVERNVFNQPEFIRALTTGYIPVKINANEQPKLADFYNIDHVPTDVVVTPQGREIQRFQSLQNANRYIAMLDGIRTQAGVGAYEPVTANAAPITQPPQQETANARPYGGSTSSQLGQSRYGQGDYGPVTSTPTAPSAGELTQGYSQDPYANAFAQPTRPQPQQTLAPRYANPYAQQDAANSNTSGSRWTQPTQGSNSNGVNRTQPPSSPQLNGYVGQGAAGGTGPSGSSLDWRQDRGAAQGRIAHNQGGPGQATQNPTIGGSNSQPRPNLGGLSHQPPVQAQSNPIQPQDNAGQPQISLDGYCPVTLVQSRVWTPGDKKWGAVHDGRVYLLAGPEQQQVFLAHPEIYAPLMAGYDPVRFAETGQLVPGHRKFGLYIASPGPIALFADEAALQRFHANSDFYFNVIRQAKVQQVGRPTR